MPAGRTYTPIATSTLSTASSTLTFSDIPQAYTDLVLVANYATGANAGAQTVYYYNGVTTGTPYSTTEISASTSASSYRYTGQNQIWISSAVGSGSSLGQTNAIIHIMNYANTTTFKTAIHRQSSISGTYPGTVGGVGLWRSTSAISSVTIKADIYSTTFSPGSRFTLYGIAAA